MATPSPPHPAVGAQLREAYEKTGLSITQLEKLSGVSRKYIRLAFQGANITVSILEKLARALGISTIKLNGLEIDMARPSLNDADVALAADLLHRGLEDAMNGLSILRRHEAGEDPNRPPGHRRP